ncbi:hypothetical protein [Halorarius halobius]|uniref:hypothetical protein n=1 Tax=Halorarius halobius TaxID=2962671 RepID=UPI0020CD800E|nr:hypothetical protein [Halorarius halobius]
MRHYDLIADLPVAVESLTLQRRERDTSSGFTRVTTTVELGGDGHVGRGEDVCYEADDHDPYPRPDLAGTYEFDGFSAALERGDLWPEEPSQHHAPAMRRWAFESAALDLALKQAGMTLGEALDREPEPVRFVVSTRLDGFDRIEAVFAVNPDAEFKLDPTPEWSDDLLERLADTGRVRTLDLKGLYEGTEVDTEPDPEFYERVLSAFPEAVIEDPGVTEETTPVLEPETDRLAWDYPITGVPSVQALPWEPNWLNIKPSRFGTVESLFDTIDYARTRDVSLYGGGQFELGVGREQIQALAALFYPDGPNDVAPGGYNDPDLSPSLPTSPLDPPVGFGRR